MSWNSENHTQPVVGACLVLHPLLRTLNPKTTRDPDQRLDEAVSLARAIELDIEHAECVNLPRIRPATLFGAGTVERLAGIIAARDIDIAIVDSTLTPIQQRNLERAWKCKVIDRTGLILEIFGARARTREGTLQVELAALSYQRSRLVRSWTHLERQRGGFGFMGGPGETQIEADRRQIDDRIFRLKKDLTEVRRTRALHRQARKRVPYVVIALVGYTNAGKSTLFNRMTKAQVIEKDQLFATLDPTMRGLTLPSGRDAILSDTVGFISDLPHELVVAFHATLEEVTEADVLIHVRDVSHSDSDAQKDDVLKVLASLDLDDDNGAPLIEVFNKSDLLNDEDRDHYANRAERSNNRMVLVSAKTGEGLDRLTRALDEMLSAKRQMMDLRISWRDGAELTWIYDHGEVLERKDKAEWVELKVMLDPADVSRFKNRAVSGKS